MLSVDDLVGVNERKKLKKRISSILEVPGAMVFTVQYSYKNIQNVVKCSFTHYILSPAQHR